MAVDVISICSLASDSQGPQTLAIVLSAMFLLYTTVTILLSGLTIYSTSQAQAPPQLSPTAAAVPIIGSRVDVGL